MCGHKDTDVQIHAEPIRQVQEVGVFSVSIIVQCISHVKECALGEFSRARRPQHAVNI